MHTQLIIPPAFGDGRLPTRFWDKVRVTPSECWVWTATTDYGYARFRVGSRSDNTTRMVRAARWAYEHLIEPIEAGLVIDHLCRNRACVYPAHLEPVTSQENILRGHGMAATRARKTHCPQGHPYSGPNLIRWAPHYGRRCRICRRNRLR